MWVSEWVSEWVSARMLAGSDHSSSSQHGRCSHTDITTPHKRGKYRSETVLQQPLVTFNHIVVPQNYCPLKNFSRHPRWIMGRCPEARSSWASVMFPSSSVLLSDRSQDLTINFKKQTFYWVEDVRVLFTLDLAIWLSLCPFLSFPFSCELLLSIL